tara:strand:+ start:4822 stop:5253 length:432 start_codon:yes stop_codon:yes gene_type:complete
MPAYYTSSGRYIKHPEAYAKTGAPMFKGKYGKKDINQTTYIYKLNLEHGKKYIGKTMDIERRMEQHFSGCGAKVTKKFKPIDYEVLDNCPGVLSDQLEQKYTEEYIEKYGYERVRGGNLVNSRDLKKCKWYSSDDSDDSDDNE